MGSAIGGLQKKSTNVYNNDNTVEHALVYLKDKFLWFFAIWSERPEFIDEKMNNLRRSEFLIVTIGGRGLMEGRICEY
ncbi:uncharacterized protein ARMOST_20327 [Armillaria ostoyae]|uniref:Uncharacterized protein n=1 Tax=Armillaria ostoyae TaxID=47428 RepID=A0A284S718_ARMOS|nr:uncharacterized protein ARMOST_20327 [Armillaria ostoyae]